MIPPLDDAAAFGDPKNQLAGDLEGYSGTMRTMKIVLPLLVE